MNNSTMSTVNRTQYQCEIKAQLFEGNWWVGFCDEWVGYYPGPDSSVPSSMRIPFDLIDDGACETQWYGEVNDNSPSNWTNSDMGGPGFASEGYGHAAYIRQPKIYLELLGGVVASWMQNGPFRSSASGSGYDPARYTVSDMFNGGTSWTRYFYVGGPGGNASGCN